MVDRGQIINNKMVLSKKDVFKNVLICHKYVALALSQRSVFVHDGRIRKLEVDVSRSVG